MPSAIFFEHFFLIEKCLPRTQNISCSTIARDYYPERDKVERSNITDHNTC